MAIIPAHGMNKEPLVKKESSQKKTKARELLIINNTFKRHAIRAGHRLYRIRFFDFKWITTNSETIRIDELELTLDPEKDVLCLGAEPREWSNHNDDDVDDKPRRRKSASFCELPRSKNR